VLTDLTEDLRLQERLKHAETLATLGRLSAQVAHEVRNPLHSIGLEAEMASEILNQEQPQRLWESKSLLRSSLQSIQFSVERLDQITENYLKLSKLSQGESKSYQLSHVIEVVLATYANQIEKDKVQLEWTYPNKEPALKGDPALMEQAIGNLIRNSLQALETVTSEERRMQLQVMALENGMLALKISDDGPGIPEALLSKLFSPFLTTKAQGTGLGLSFVKKVIEDQGGQIVYVPKHPKGACFEIKLPIQEKESHSHNKSPQEFA
jgi:signal transduction histidine kinase